MRRIALPTLGCLLILPALAHADALDGAFLMLEIMAGLAGLVLVIMLFTLLAYLRPASLTLRVISLVFGGLSAVLGLAWQLLFNGAHAASMSGFGDFNPFLSLTIPFAAWLGGVQQAAAAARPSARRWWVAIAAAGAQLVFGTFLSLVLRWVLPIDFSMQGAGYYGRWLLGLAASFGLWWLVLRQAERQQPLGWQHWRSAWQVSGLAVVIGMVYSYLPILPLLARAEGQWLAPAASHSLVSWVVGALAVWLQQRRAAVVA